MNFTEYLESWKEPLFEADGIPHCPPGYRFDKKNLMCVPKSKKDDVSGNRDEKRNMEPGNMPSFNTIGSHGQNGAPYAYEESRPPNPWGYEPGRPWTKLEDQEGAKYDYYNGGPEASPFFEMNHDYEKYDKEAKEFKKKDDRMKYGRDGKASSLRPGEVRKPNSRGGYDSNKD